MIKRKNIDLQYKSNHFLLMKICWFDIYLQTHVYSQPKHYNPWLPQKAVHKKKITFQVKTISLPKCGHTTKNQTKQIKLNN